MAMVSSQQSLSVLALLDLPLGTVLTLDGKSIVLQTCDFVGFDQIPTEDDECMFHLITVRATAPSRDGNSQREYSSPITTGFIFAATRSLVPANDTMAIIRRFDINTSEVSSDPVDEQTESSLLESIRQGHIDTQRLISYHRVFSATDVEAWKSRTKFVTTRLLRKRGLHHGDKIIPGTYDSEDSLLQQSAKRNLDNTQKSFIVDGKAVVYPPIPVLDKARGTRHATHAGTRAYLAQLSPSDRTRVFMDTAPSSLMESVLERYYDLNRKELLGDLQLSYLLFLCLHCLSSFEHWRDLVALVSTADSDQVIHHLDFYENVLSIFGSQIQLMESDFFEDVEFSGDNFLVPSIRRLCLACFDTNDATLRSKLQAFTQIVSRRIPQALEDSSKTTDDQPSSGFAEDEVMTDNALASDGDQDNDDEDGPVVIPEEEIEAFTARSTEWKSYPQLQYSQSLRESYPVLFAAMMPQEDVLMTCARALDEAKDVSLAREAAAYLENVEAEGREC